MSKRAPYISIAEFCAEYLVSRTTVYSLIKDRKIIAKKIGARTVIDLASANRWAAKLPRLIARRAS